MVDFVKLKAEIVADPLGRGYTGMTDAKVVDSLNVIDRTRDRTVVPAHEVFEALDFGELKALTVDSRQIVLGLLAMGDMNLKGPNLRAAFGTIFGAGPTTRANLVALQTEPVSRAEELEIGFVRPGDVARARAV